MLSSYPGQYNLSFIFYEVFWIPMQMICHNVELNLSQHSVTHAARNN